jgi:membrane protein DedA with SNARE-associated domain
MNIIEFLKAHEQWKYLIIFIAAIIEGPYLTVVCGFLVTKGLLNPFYVYGLMIAGDFTGDGFYYSIGFCGSFLLKWYGVTPEKIEAMRNKYQSDQFKMVMVSKLFYGPGIIGLAAAGALKVPYKKFFVSCLVISLVQSTVFLFTGLFFGTAYQSIGAWLNYYAAAATVLILFALFIYGMWMTKKKMQ